MSNVPIYRAKNKYSDEYVKGDLINKFLRGVAESANSSMLMISDTRNSETEIDTSTLAIHFPDMIDSEGTKIFAGLSEDGKGGDTVVDSYNEKYTVLFNKLTSSVVCAYMTKQMQQETNGVYKEYWKTYKVIGIQQ